jgi:integration host factor subunit alpha
MSTVTRAYLADEIYSEVGISHIQSGQVVDNILELMIQELVDGNAVKIAKFGSFRPRKKNARIGRNPRTKEEHTIAARKVVSFYASNTLKDSLN